MDDCSRYLCVLERIQERLLYTKEFEQLVRSLADTEGLELVECSVTRLRRSQVFRVLIDSIDGGVPVDACGRLSRQISDELDENPMLEGNYQIEVSSAGMNRKIWSAEHFCRFEGEQARIDLQVPADPKVWIGTIGAASGDDCFVLVLENGDEREICISDIEVARLRMDPWKQRPKQKR